MRRCWVLELCIQRLRGFIWGERLCFMSFKCCTTDIKKHWACSELSNGNFPCSRKSLACYVFLTLRMILYAVKWRQFTFMTANHCHYKFRSYQLCLTPKGDRPSDQKNRNQCNLIKLSYSKNYLFETYNVSSILRFFWVLLWLYKPQPLKCTISTIIIVLSQHYRASS